MRMYDIISAKKNGRALTEEEIRYFVRGYSLSEIPDYQASALAMAVCLNGMNEAETVILTDAMAKSGTILDLSVFGDMSCDKHSTGGVGDKTTVIVAPLAAELGCKVAKMSGRGLGHTGGTLDKLESIGMNVSLTSQELISQTEKIGVAVTGSTSDLAPADKKLYELRDVTATVDSIPLIASSIMSKKIAAGAKNIVLDVKYGSGAFMKSKDDAQKLAEQMERIGLFCGRNVRAILSDMSEPLGDYIGNLLEIKEAIGVLRCEVKGELRRECILLAATMLSMAHKVPLEEALVSAEKALDSGRAYDRFIEWVKFQGGNAFLAVAPSKMPKARFRCDVTAPFDAHIGQIDTEKIGMCAGILGAGRITKTSVIDYTAGIHIVKKTTCNVAKGDIIARLYSQNRDVLPVARKMLLLAYGLG